MKLLLVLAFVTYSLTFVSGQVPLKDGKCPDSSQCTVPNITFTADLFNGYWYFYSQIPLFFQAASRCHYMYFTEHFGPEGNIHLRNHGIDNETGKTHITEGYTNVTPGGGLTVSYSYLKIPFTFQVVDVTDDYFIVYSCYECGLFSSKGSGIYIQALTRLHSPECSTIEAIKKKFAECGVEEKFISYTDNVNCNSCASK